MLMLNGVNMQQHAGTYDTVSRQWIYTFAEVMPEYPGGEQALNNYLASNLRYPKGNEEMQTSVSLAFIIQPDGKTAFARALNKPVKEYTRLDKEMIIIVEKMPKWKPGRNKGIAVPVKMFLRIPCILLGE